ncbi:hypothetical protein [Arthrobacter sp. EPSL27]|uniref:hypothetical protein n=1 Tax=Arthrobacter sp. EPSL27 TaxID=1745378 RepID=UPI000A9C8425|nr:hypothetical protein [Arthrobacter sp. EPSL27]
MKTKWLVAAGAGVAALLGGTAVALDQMTAAESSVSGAPPAGNSPHTAGSSPGDAGTAGVPGAPGSGGEASAGSTAAPSRGSADGAASVPVGREVLPPVSATPTGLPAPTAPAALVSAPLPAAASAQGGIVDGYPTDILPFPDATVLVSTSVSPAEGTLQVAADAIAPLSQDAVAGHYQQVLGGLGFWSEPVPAADGQRAIRFGRGTDSLTFTASTTGTGGTRFMLLGNLRAADGG